MSMRKNDDHCEICNKLFNMIHLKHQCHKCHIAVCNQCSKRKWKLNIKEQTQKKRVCDICYVILSKAGKHKELIDDHHAFQLASDNFLTDPSKNILNVLLSTFEKCWLRDKYPEYYQEKVKEYIEECMNKSEPKKKKKRRMLHKSEAAIGRGHDFGETPHENTENTHHNPTIQKTKNNEIIFISAGVLWVNIMKAGGVPDCDSVGKPDPYCKYYITSNDKYFAEDGTCVYPPKYRTKILENTFNPEWNEDKSIILLNTTGKLVVELWDHDRVSKDNYLGKCEIPLNSLYLHYSCNPSDNQVIDDWFELTIIDKYKDKINRKRAEIENIHSDSFTPIYTKLESVPNLDTDVDINDKCYIRLQIKLYSSWYGNLVSHFDAVLPPQEETKFDLNVTMSEINKLLLDLFPMIDISNQQIQVIKWIKYPWSMVYVVLFTFFTFYPWFMMFYIQFRLLVYICRSYIKLDQTRKKQINLTPAVYWICLFFGNLSRLFRKVMAQHVKNRTEQQSSEQEAAEKKTIVEFDENDEVKMQGIDDEQEISLGAFTKIVGKSAIKVSGLKTTLAFIQEILILVNRGIKFMKSICKWKDEQVHIVSIIVIGLFVMCILTVVFRETNFFRYELYFIGMSILTFYSKPVQFCLWIILGVAYWYNSYYRFWKMFQVENGSQELMRMTPKLLQTSSINEQIMDDLKGVKIKNKVKIKKQNCVIRLWLKIRDFGGWIMRKIFSNKENKIA